MVYINIGFAKPEQSLADFQAPSTWDLDRLSTVPSLGYCWSSSYTMVAASKTFLAAGALGLAAAVPVNQDQPTSFKVVQQRNPNYDDSIFVPRGALAMYKAYMKYGKPVPEGINKTVSEYRAAKQARRVKRATSGAVTTTPVDDDLEYIVSTETFSTTHNVHLFLGFTNPLMKGLSIYCLSLAGVNWPAQIESEMLSPWRYHISK